MRAPADKSTYVAEFNVKLSCPAWGELYVLD